MKLEELQLSHELVYECFFMKVYEDDVRLPNNLTSKRIYIMHNSAAAVLPITIADKIILIKQYRYPIRSESIEIPAGKKDFLGESGLACAKRELEEETGYGTENIDLIQTINSCVGYSNETIDLFVARDCVKILNPKKGDDDEFVEVIEVDKLQAKNLVLSGEISDAKTLIALQWFFLQENK
jgi:ADP-ribose pyrophosphatase